jgi:thioredoxin reductase (NADPH)
MATTDLLIIGSGPAGYTAAIYAARASLSPIILEGPLAGGQLTTTTEVENFPGFANGIMGPDLMGQMKAQAERFGAKFIPDLATEVDFSRRPFKVKTQSGDTIIAQMIIVSTGASAKYLNLPHEKELIGKGVSACATCDGFFYRGKIVHVVGGGDTAIEESHFLTKFASKVTIIHRRDSLRASKAMQQRAKDNKKIEFLWNSEVLELLYDSKGLNAIKVKNTQTQEITVRPTDGLFMGIGHTPNTSFLKGKITLDETGYITTHNEVETNIPGVFACGDVCDHYYRQAITAAGSGCQGAMRAERFLSEYGRV